MVNYAVMLQIYLIVPKLTEFQCGRVGLVLKRFYLSNCKVFKCLVQSFLKINKFQNHICNL